MAPVRPQSPEELAALLAEAGAAGQRLRLAGSGSRPGLSPAADGRTPLELTGIGGRIDHDPAELLLTAPAATPLAQVNALLAAAGQCLAFEPPDPAPIWGCGHGTLGGAVASGLSGPRRLVAGAARDHVLGLAGVTGRGEMFRAGGKVLKNVTGFDLPRLLTGSLGRLAALTEITVKVLPLPPGQATLSVPAGSPGDAVALMTRALQVDGGITAAAATDGLVHLRIEGSLGALPALVAAAQARLPGSLLLEGEASRTLWAGIASLDGHARADEIIWRCPLPATRAPALADALPARARLLLDWGGALAFVMLPADMADVDVHAAVASAAGRDGHARRLRLPAGVDSAVPAEPRLDPALALLNARVRAQFDPTGVLSA